MFKITMNLETEKHNSLPSEDIDTPSNITDETIINLSSNLPQTNYDTYNRKSLPNYYSGSLKSSRRISFLFYICTITLSVFLFKKFKLYDIPCIVCISIMFVLYFINIVNFFANRKIYSSTVSSYDISEEYEKSTNVIPKIIIYNPDDYINLDMCEEIEICSFSKSINTKTDDTENDDTKIDYTKPCVIYILYEFIHGNRETGKYIKSRINNYINYHTEIGKIRRNGNQIYCAVKERPKLIIYYPNNISNYNAFVHLMFSFLCLDYVYYRYFISKFKKYLVILNYKVYNTHV